MATIIAVPNEGRGQASRITREGKKITYVLSVIQQPARARACGSGAKSSADRRPVDPPPIVELRIYEGEPTPQGDYANDITTTLNATFLFATLEHARTMAHGRVPQTPASLPVLTGMAVAGMAHLDRPVPSGYFIFPDLSVRHEGKFRLSFSLYEALKEAKDADGGEQSTKASGPTEAHVTYRLGVKSQPFTVFSAKKFPGLEESTALSRIVAEQGCRVRIRRDVRMRRRDTKHPKGWNVYVDDTGRARRTATPDAYGQAPTPHPDMESYARHRSNSVVSNGGYAMPLQRRLSSQELAQAYQQQSYGPPHLAPQTPPSAYMAQMGYGAVTPQQYQQPYTPLQPMMHPPHPQYQQQQQQQHYQMQLQMQAPQNYAGYMPHQYYAPAQPQYEQPHHVRHESLDYASAPLDQRRTSVAAPQPQQYPIQSQMPVPVPFGTLDGINRSHPMNQQPPYRSNGARTPIPPNASAGHSLPPLNTTLQAPREKTGATSPVTAIPGPISAPGHHDTPKPPMVAAPSSTPTQSTAARKRSFDDAFDTQHLNQPLRQGARPSLTHSHSASDCTQALRIEDEGEEELSDHDKLKMVYRRADGTEVDRRLPPHT
ncbi:velvet factor-domain-containing protein [Cryomyces antarcticus]